MVAFDAKPRILIIDENQAIHAEFRGVLARARSKENATFGVSMQLSSGEVSTRLPAPEFEVDSAYHGEEGLELVEGAKQDARPYALVFVAVTLPPPWAVAETIGSLLAADFELQIVLCISDADESREAILCQFASTGRVLLLKKPFEIAETWLLTTSVAHKWSIMHDTNERLRRQTEQIADAGRKMSIIEGRLDELEHTHEELRLHSSLLMDRLELRQAEIAGTRDLTMFALAQLADSRDPETGEHLLRMRAYGQLLAEHLSKYGLYADVIDRAFLAEFYRSTPLHDIGKVGIPDQILLKPGPLTHDEFEIMKQHTVIGAEALEKAAKLSSFGGFLEMAAVIARSHHEKFDGTGYPDGLRGETIPLCARITAVADVFDALTSARVYKDAMRCEDARELIISNSERQFDPAVIEAFDACYDEFLKVKVTVDEGQVDPDTRGIRSVSPLPLIEPEPMLGNLLLLPTL